MDVGDRTPNIGFGDAAPSPITDDLTFEIDILPTRELVLRAVRLLGCHHCLLYAYGMTWMIRMYS
ncbi:MAG: hypothetical protein ACXVQ6_12250, partial [Actinomycetota bacterium]